VGGKLNAVMCLDFTMYPDSDSVLFSLRKEEALSDQVARAFQVCQYLSSLILVKEAPVQITPADRSQD